MRSGLCLLRPKPPAHTAPAMLRCGKMTVLVGLCASGHPWAHCSRGIYAAARSVYSVGARSSSVKMRVCSGVSGDRCRIGGPVPVMTVSVSC